MIHTNTQNTQVTHGTYWSYLQSYTEATVTPESYCSYLHSYKEGRVTHGTDYHTVKQKVGGLQDLSTQMIRRLEFHVFHMCIYCVCMYFLTMYSAVRISSCQIMLYKLDISLLFPLSRQELDRSCPHRMNVGGDDVQQQRVASLLLQSQHTQSVHEGRQVLQHRPWLHRLCQSLRKQRTPEVTLYTVTSIFCHGVLYIGATRGAMVSTSAFLACHQR